MIGTGVAEGVAGNLITTLGQHAFGWIQNKIQITYPRNGAVLEHPQLVAGVRSYQIQGRLPKLNNGHEIWLLRQDKYSTAFRPQGFKTVDFDKKTGEWVGWVNAVSSETSKIVAVVAPPTSCDYFMFWQTAGMKLSGLNAGGFEPIHRLPPECRNQDSIQVLVP